jgi:hypothetical protein
MALPTTGPLSLNDIRIEIGASSTNVSLGAMSDTAGFSAPDAITDFYGFSASLTSFLGSSLQNGVKFICNQTRNVTFYHNGSNAFPVVGDNVYTNSGGTTPAVGYSRVGLSYNLTNSAGVVTNIYPCII